MKDWKTSFALMASCLMLVSCSSSSEEGQGGNDTCSFTGARCSADNTAVEKCVDGELKTDPCTAGCSAGICNKVPTGETCDYTGSKCSDDKQNLLSCENGQESSQPCPFGCAENACQDEPGPGPGPDVALPRVTGLEPNSGKAGTEVTIKGANLDKATKAFFGAMEVDVKSASANSVVVVAPQLEGSVTVGVIVDGKRLSAGQFTYLAPSENEAAVDWCQLTYFKPTIKPGEALEAYAQVYEEEKTGVSGSHELHAQVGYAKDLSQAGVPEAYTWLDAKYNDAFSDVAAQTNDEYMTDGTTYLATGKYSIAYRFSLDGMNWTYCDTNGSQDGFSGDQAGIVTVSELPEPPKVDWCRIVNENTSISAEVDTDTEHVYAQAFVPDCTDYQTHCAQLKAQVGYGTPALSTPSAIADGYVWTDATINTGYDGSGGTKHDEFMAKLHPETAGTYAVVYRMSVDDGATWTYCDTSDDVLFSVTDAMTLTVREKGSAVEPPTPEKTIEWCRVQDPATLSVRAGQSSAAVYGRVYVPGCTGTDKACEGLQAEVGFGSNTAAVDTFTFVSATYNDKANAGNNDEFFASLTPTAAGDYAVVYRFSLDGENWTYCDYDDAHGFKMENAVPMNVYDKEKILWCRTVLEKNEAFSLEDTRGYGQVWVENCSEGEKKCESIKAEIGYLKDGVEAQDGVYWDTIYNEAVIMGNNDEYIGHIKLPIGNYRIVYRFSVDDGETWTYCDGDADAGFNASNLPRLKVKHPVEWCQVYMNSPVSVAKRDVETDMIYGQAFVAGCSDKNNARACETLEAEIGYGTGDDVSGFKFVNADYIKDVGYNDEFGAKLTFDEVGEYKVVYAFTMNNGQRKYCSLNGSKPFDLADAGVVKVVEPSTDAPEIKWCRIVSEVPDVMTVGSEYKIYAQAYVEGCTEAGGACEGLTGYVGYGTSLEDMATVSTSSATYFKDVGNNDEFVATLKPESAGEHKVAFAFSMDGGKTKTWCTTDTNNPQNLSTANTVRVNAPEAMKIDWCRVQHPQTLTVKQGETSEAVYGQLYVNGCTDGAMKCDAVMAQAGYGRTDQAVDTWTWVNAVYNEHATTTNNDEYAATFNIGRDVVDMTYGLLYRFSLDNGQTWTLCDFDEDPGFDVANAAQLTVKLGDPVAGEPFVRGTDFSCGIDRQFATIPTNKDAETDFFGQIWMPGCTDNGKCPKVVGAHLHYIQSAMSHEPILTSTKWTVLDASHNDAYLGASNDEYMVKQKLPKGHYAYAWSFDLKHDPSDAAEKAQRVFCFVDWQEYGFGTIEVNE